MVADYFFIEQWWLSKAIWAFYTNTTQSISVLYSRSHFASSKKSSPHWYFELGVENYVLFNINGFNIHLNNLLRVYMNRFSENRAPFQGLILQHVCYSTLGVAQKWLEFFFEFGLQF